MTVTYIKILGMSSKSCDNLPGIQPCLAPLVEQRFCHLMNFCQAIQQFGQVRRVLCVSLLLKQPKAFRCQQRFCKRDLRVDVLALWTGVKRQGRINWNTLVLQQEDDRHQQCHQQNNDQNKQQRASRRQTIRFQLFFRFILVLALDFFQKYFLNIAGSRSEEMHQCRSFQYRSISALLLGAGHGDIDLSEFVCELSQVSVRSDINDVRGKGAGLRLMRQSCTNQVNDSVAAILLTRG